MISTHMKPHADADKRDLCKQERAIAEDIQTPVSEISLQTTWLHGCREVNILIHFLISSSLAKSKWLTDMGALAAVALSRLAVEWGEIPG